MNITKVNKGQMSIFVILAVVLVLGIVMFYAMVPSEVDNVSQTEVGALSSSDISSLESYIEDKLTMLIEAAIVSGRIEDEDDLMAYLDEDSKVIKVLNLEQFRERVHSMETGDLSYQVDISSNRDFIIFDVEYPIMLQVGDSITSLKNFRVKVPMTFAKEIPVDSSGVVLETTVFDILDGRAQLYIPAGTRATLNGEAVSEITIDTSRVVNGHTVYNLGPDGAEFNPPIAFSVSWEDMVFSPGYTYEDMAIGMFYEANSYQSPDVPKMTNMVNSGYRTPAAFIVPEAIVNGRRVPLVYHNEDLKLTSIPVTHFSEFLYGTFKSADGTIIEPSVALEDVGATLKCFG